MGPQKFIRKIRKVLPSEVFEKQVKRAKELDEKTRERRPCPDKECDGTVTYVRKLSVGRDDEGASTSTNAGQTGIGVEAEHTQSAGRITTGDVGNNVIPCTECGRTPSEIPEQKKRLTETSDSAKIESASDTEPNSEADVDRETSADAEMSPDRDIDPT